MIKTALPYDMDKMNEIAQEGAIVDMSQLSFPSIPEDKQIRTTMIYLRNTNFNNVLLDFSSCSYKMKVQYLKEYLLTDIRVTNEEFAQMALEVLAYNKNDHLNVIFTEAELRTLWKEQKELLLLLKDILHGILIFAITQLQESSKFDLTDISVRTEELGPNYINLLQYDYTSEFLTDETVPSLFKCFERDKEEIMRAVINSSFGLAQALYAVSSMSQEELVSGLEAIDEALIKEAQWSSNR